MYTIILLHKRNCCLNILKIVFNTVYRETMYQKNCMCQLMMPGPTISLIMCTENLDLSNKKYVKALCRDQHFLPLCDYLHQEITLYCLQQKVHMGCGQHQVQLLLNKLILYIQENISYLYLIVINTNLR